MKIVCIGGGPAGLYFALLMKKADPGHDITVVERNRPYDTFGWGVVFSDQTLGNLQAADAPTAQAILDAFNHWDDIEIHIRGRTVRSGGHGFCGIGRKRLLNILQARCEALGVKLQFETEVESDEQFADADLIIASDGLNSRIRNRYAHVFQPDIDLRRCRFVWLGTHKLFDAFTFAFEETEFGWFQAHAYRFDTDTSTFIVETPEEVWRAAGLDRMDKEEAIAFCETLFSKYLDGHRLMSNAAHLRGSAQWIRFPRVVCRTWVHHNGRAPVVLMGDAAHTAHFSIGSGTKLALEDAIELARCIGQRRGDLMGALQDYEAVRSVEVLRIQNAARNSTEWFENVRRYVHLPPEQFAYSLLTRSQRISHENLRLRDRGYVERYEDWLAERSGVRRAPHAQPVPPMFTPYRVRGLQLKNRVVVSPMAQYSAVDGIPGDYHLVHLGARAMGGAGLVFAEMTCVSPDARITPHCPGLWNDAQQQAWQRIVDYVHAHTDAKIALQLGHAGPKGSTNAPWEGEGADRPLPQGNWPLISASAVPYLEDGPVPRAMTREDMDRVKADFVAATRRAAAAGFDWLELHCAHGYLLSAFISPLTNRRDDEYGGPLENRLRYPLEVFRAMREAWPGHLPMSVRISAHDWVEGGTTPDDAVEIARAFKAAGADMIDCSSGQVSVRQQPVYGRMYQTPFADRIRNEAGIPTIAVGAISEADHVNSIIAAGRADLCAIARPHLANPAWTLMEAARIGYTDLEWPRPYRAAKTQLERNLEREKAAAAQVAGLSPLQQANLALGV
ncbi:bifunctional salicylyl-CoA 5-hydroxylase/oxidoreductase [Caldimonas thermodepolymerans]|uniref:Anthraniloyl-CoA monooxygenase n=1 Tax=Caldimonas thermodepolymerans TaxID=215580 RepID=A0A2S5T670_9BURK|nr:bifunctional salicylyl-CoA 5-hydroxylase/oxidoreductase [Caldimonas thermodepolymerans]PPE70367.1 bifunctional salicylyl-CoA 5-hydroxylase/oxidoreductase [Caldimonas thermodepolymerans]QPC30275.1 bifunctional salicylyl-CoA 5-hydroxylase/oxidoreductase [Caldimonas thermodepolymerans]RDI00669.1 anthraniloyl-CoA monooxygenase [Caldimonas thermodepolymerans]TCP07052.1 anthraniloyl-CoA monooxygenase [Caldimonas thermodepolymerans]UZG46701.1 bifunctional salicylyl-CoA 5-hydroxylase/oxidoreductase